MDKKELDQIAAMLEQAPERIEEFQKETYEASFQKYLQDHAHIWRMLADIWEGKSLPRQQNAMEVAECLVTRAQKMLEEVRGRAKRETMRLNLNLYMVSYFLPAIVAFQRRCGGMEDEMKKLTETICDRWEECFGQRIQASDHESIQAGFKNKLCFVTTAVCSGLHKSQDCQELAMMKCYRDEYMAGTKEGDALIREYYDIAPTIVKRIEREDSPEEKYRYLWDTYIRKCVDLVAHNENEACKKLYETMMLELKEEYMVTDWHRRQS